MYIEREKGFTAQQYTGVLHGSRQVKNIAYRNIQQQVSITYVQEIVDG